MPVASVTARTEFTLWASYSRRHGAFSGKTAAAVDDPFTLGISTATWQTTATRTATFQTTATHTATTQTTATHTAEWG